MISPSLLALIGSLIAFIPWNWSPAKLFMGDTGSTFLGAIYISYALNAYSMYQHLHVNILQNLIVNHLLFYYSLYYI